MSDYVGLQTKRNRGWPWPDTGIDLSPMFGEDGWCRSCGTPKRSQTGSLVLLRKAVRPEGAWIPYGPYDVVCLSQALAEEVDSRFDVAMRPVVWHASSPGDAMQIVIPTVGDAWFDAEELRDRTLARHGEAGATCADCGTWRWMPLPFEHLPPFRITPGLAGADIAASPEWFGDGRNSYREVVMRRELAELLASASPRDFRVVSDIPVIEEKRDIGAVDVATFGPVRVPTRWQFPVEVGASTIGEFAVATVDARLITGPLTTLAEPAEAQIAYLAGRAQEADLSDLDVVQELSEEFADGLEFALPALQDSPASRAALAAVEEALSNSRLTPSIDTLRTDPGWARLRELAEHALSVLKNEGAIPPTAD